MTNGNKEPGITHFDGGKVTISDNSEYKKYDFLDDAFANSRLVLAHELFHGIDVPTFDVGNNILMSHNKNSTALKTNYKEISGKLFQGNQNRIYHESRAVAYESMIRYNRGGDFLPMRFIYTPFRDVNAFSTMIIEACKSLKF
jgi:hypothetical protein